MTPACVSTATRVVWRQVSGEKEFFANLVVDAVMRLDIKTLDLRMVGMKKVQVGPMPYAPPRCTPALHSGSSTM